MSAANLSLSLSKDGRRTRCSTLVVRQAHYGGLGPQCHSRAGGNPAAGSPAREKAPSHRRRGALDPRLRGDDDEREMSGLVSSPPKGKQQPPHAIPFPISPPSLRTPKARGNPEAAKHHARYSKSPRRCTLRDDEERFQQKRDGPSCQRAAPTASIRLVQT